MGTEGDLVPLSASVEVIKDSTLYVFQDCLQHPAILYGSYPGVTIAETNWIILKAEKFKEEGGRSKT